ncbi:YlzJ-like family protein [Paenibacillus thiaminolyticus]|uniref:YlzJ-like family protein n=1 Tax=Paenibacillus thiaminolyticus TaxID=49283 RepID=UPI002350FB09|nr:YlzJ-like family protein [Paenibacillus thiaminolyticus]WCR29020.1 YlzJ-like family protein [Paenibacillus thiaminolyticus]
MLHSIIPMEEIWRGYEKEPRFFEMNRNGRTLLVQAVDGRTVRIERLLKEQNIQDFLQPEYMPGTMISLG